MCKKLKHLLIDRNISQKKLSEVIGSSEAYVSQVLSGVKTPSLRFLKKIASFLDVTIDELVD